MLNVSNIKFPNNYLSVMESKMYGCIQHKGLVLRNVIDLSQVLIDVLPVISQAPHSQSVGF